MRRALACLLVVSAVLLVSPIGAAATTVPPTLLIGSDFPDPDIVRFGATYYAYSTNNGNGNVPVATAPAVTGRNAVGQATSLWLQLA